MNKKTNIIMGIVLLSLMSIYFFLKNLSPQHSSNLLESIPRLNNIQNIDQIEIYRSQSDQTQAGITLTKSNTAKWILSSHQNIPVNDQKVANFIKIFQNIEGTLRADKIETFSNFDISDEKALHIIFKNQKQKEIYHLLLGKPAPSFNQSFVRLSNNPHVFLIYQNIYSFLNMWNQPETSIPDPKPWFNLDILNQDMASIKSISIHSFFSDIEIQSQNKESTLNNQIVKNQTWAVIGYPEINSLSLESWIQQFIHFKATDIHISDHMQLPESFDLTIKLSLNDQSSIELLFWPNKDSEQIYFKFRDQNTIYLTSIQSIQFLIHPIQIWNPIQLESFLPEKIQSISINHPTQSISLNKTESNWNSSIKLPSFEINANQISNYLNKITQLKPLNQISNEIIDFPISIQLNTTDQEVIYKVGNPIRCLNQMFYPFMDSLSQQTFWINESQKNELFPTIDYWGTSSILSNKELDDYYAVRIDKNAQIFEYDERNEALEEPDWFEELYDLLDETEILAFAPSKISHISETMNPIFLELQFENFENKKMILGKNNESYYIEVEAPFAIYQINSSLYELLNQLTLKSENHLSETSENQILESTSTNDF